jgi:hypothetical protein
MASGSGVCHQHLQQNSLAWINWGIRTPVPDVAALAGCLRPAPEASIKIVPAWADQGDTLVLKDSWNKAGGDKDYIHGGAAATPR